MKTEWVNLCQSFVLLKKNKVFKGIRTTPSLMEFSCRNSQSAVSYFCKKAKDCS